MNVISLMGSIKNTLDRFAMDTSIFFEIMGAIFIIVIIIGAATDDPDSRNRY